MSTNTSCEKTGIVGVLGAHHASRALYDCARATGAAIARNGWWLVCGGLSGVMEGACRGARESGGHTIGVLPGMQREDANPWVELPIVSGLADARNTIIVRTAHACIALPGSYGTLSEIAFCLKFGTPVVALTCGDSDPVLFPGLRTTDDPDTACAWLISEAPSLAG